MNTVLLLLVVVLLAAFFFAAGHQWGKDAERSRQQTLEANEQQRFLSVMHDLARRADGLAPWDTPGAIERLLRAPLGEPNFADLLEAYIPLPSPPTWRGHIDCLRREVAPLVAELLSKGLITWYQFLVHEPPQELRTQVGAASAVHLRLTPPSQDGRRLTLERLGAASLAARVLQPPDLAQMDNLDPSAMTGGNATAAWLLLGEASRLSLLIVCLHRPNVPVPERNVGQLLHYIDNQLQLAMAGIRLGVNGRGDR